MFTRQFYKNFKLFRAKSVSAKTWYCSCCMLVYKLLICLREADDLLYGLQGNNDTHKRNLTKNITVRRKLHVRLTSKGFFDFVYYLLLPSIHMGNDTIEL